MQISLKDWKEIENSIIQLKKVLNDTHTTLLEKLDKQKGNKAEYELLSKMIGQLLEVEQEMSYGLLNSSNLHPQSEWLGGNSDNPNNHALREPNAVPMPRRRFTAKEISEANAECLGAVHWVFKK